jgi:hypothetical protein
LTNTALSEVDASAMPVAGAVSDIKVGQPIVTEIPSGITVEKTVGIGIPSVTSNYVIALGKEVEVGASEALTETGGVGLSIGTGLLDPTVAPGVVQIYKGTQNPTASWNTGSRQQICEMFPDQDGCSTARPPPPVPAPSQPAAAAAK